MKHILICGVGAIGSWLSTYLAVDTRDEHKITIVDFDKVAERNIQAGTQFYLREQIGLSKTEALQFNIYKFFNRSVDIRNVTINKTNAQEVRNFDLIIDCFDNFEARTVITEACRTIPCVHVGFSPTMTFSILWEEYQPPEDITSDFDVCTMRGASSFVHMVATIGSSVVQEYLTTGKKREVTGNKFFVREIL